MEKTLYLHIGTHKTGTTSLQRFLSMNRNKLRREGYLYPGNDDAHHDMVEEFFTSSLDDIRRNAMGPTCRYFKEINTSGFDKIILSSENFENLNKEIVSLKEFLTPEFKVKIIFYVRRQDEKLESVYNESVKGPEKRYSKSFSEFIEEKIGSATTNFPIQGNNANRSAYADYYSILMPWNLAFGKENIFVRCYEKEQLPKGIYHNFLNAIGLTLDETYKIPQTRLNESLSWDLIDVIRICNTSIRNDQNFHRFLLKHLTEINFKNKGRRQRLLSPQQQREIISRFRDSNAKVAREYLGRSDGQLFYALPPDLNEPWTQYNDITLESIVPVFTCMLFDLDRELRARKSEDAKTRLKGKMIIAIKNTGLRLGLLPAMRYWYDRFYNS